MLVNKAMLAEYHAISPDMVVGKYNVFKDPDVIATGQVHALKRAFHGEIVFFPDVRVPLEGIAGVTAYRTPMWRPYTRTSRFSLFWMTKNG